MPVSGIEQKNVIQIGVIVRDIERTAAHYTEILGLPTPATILLHDDLHANYHGQETHVQTKICCIQMGQVQFELLQPLNAPNAWHDFLDQHGEGIHHIAFFPSPTEKAAASFGEYGYEIIQQSYFGERAGMYTYLNTDKDMAVVIELLEHFSSNQTFSSPPVSPDQGIGTDTVCQVGIMVRDIEKTAQRISDVLGLPQPPIFSTPGYEVVKTTYNSEPCDATAKLCFFNVGQLQIELIEPDEKPSVWRDFLDQQGERAHHIAFPIQDTQRVTDYLAQHGIPISQQGYYGDLSGMYTYLASEDKLGTAVELLENFPR